MLPEILLTLVIGAAIAFIVFLIFFNTEQVDEGKSNKNKNKNKKKNKNKPKTSPKSSKSSKKKLNVYKDNPVKNKQKIKLGDHEHLVSVFRAHSGEITGVTWHESGELLLSSGKDKYIYIWQNPTESQISSSYIGCVKAQDGGYFSCLSTVIRADKITKPKQPDYAVDDKKDDNVLTKHDEIANSVFASTNVGYGFNSYLLKATATSNKIRLQITSNIQTEFKEDMKYICVHPQLLYGIVSGSHDTKVYVYDILKKKRQQKSRKIKINAPTSGNKKKNVNADKALQVIDGGQFINYQMSISPDGDYLSIGTFKKDIRIWKVNWIKPEKRAAIQTNTFGSLEVLTYMTDAHRGPVTCVVFSNDSNYLISASKDACIKVWDIKNVDYARGEKIKLVMETSLDLKNKKIGIAKFVMSDQYDALAVIDDNGKQIYIYHLKYEKKKIKFICKLESILCNEKEGKITSMKFSPNCQYIAVGTTDMDVRVYKIPQKQQKSKK